MWSETLPSGKIRFQERYTNPLTGKSGRVSTTADKLTNATKKIAERVLQEKIAQKIGQVQQDTVYTLSDVYDAYCAYQKENTKVSTSSRNEIVNRVIINMLDKDVRVDALTAAYVEKKLSCEKATTYNEHLVRFKAMIRWAYMHDMIENISWLDKLRNKPDNKKERIEEKYLEKEELRQVLDAMKIKKWKLLTEFLALTGLRIGEAMALTKDDVNLKQKTILVNKTYTIHMKKLTQSAKTETSNRIISIQDELVPVIEDICSMVEQYTVVSFNNGSPLFFPSENGGYLMYDAYRQYFGDYTEKVIGKRLTPHALRHTMTSLFAEAGVPLEVITRRLGHADSDITKKIYLHITQKQREMDAAAIKSVSII